MIIKHRAKTTDGKWVEGLIGKSLTDKTYLIDYQSNDGWNVSKPVDPTTIEPILPVCEWKYSPNSARDFITTCGAIETPHHGKYIPYCFCPNCGGRIEEIT